MALAPRLRYCCLGVEPPLLPQVRGGVVLINNMSSSPSSSTSQPVTLGKSFHLSEPLPQLPAEYDDK